jgi:glycosyltransferase involved in cell wall biosynthesis
VLRGRNGTALGDGGAAALPAVSVVIPTCDRPHLLRRALASVRAQTLAPAEIIVVDDGRTAAPALAEAAVRLLVNDRARGVSGARNCGAAAARQPLLAFLDDDDVWLPTYLATAVAKLAAERLDVVCTDLLYRYDDGSEAPGKPAMAALVLDDFLVRNPGLVGSNLLIRAAAYRAVGGFDESLLAATDMDLGVRLCLHRGIRYAPLRQRLVCHHHHAEPRLCTRHGAAMHAGIHRFYALHGPRMTPAQRQEFRVRMQRLWGIDDLARDLGAA